MKKLLPYLLPVLLLISFVLLMNGGNYLKNPRGNADNFQLHMHEVRNNLEKSEWPLARQNFKKMSIAWDKVTPRIQFSVEKDEINAIYINLARLNGLIQTREAKNALVELYETEEHWKHLNY